MKGGCDKYEKKVLQYLQGAYAAYTAKSGGSQISTIDVREFSQIRVSPAKPEEELKEESHLLSVTEIAEDASMMTHTQMMILEPDSFAVCPPAATKTELAQETIEAIE